MDLIKPIKDWFEKDVLEPIKQWFVDLIDIQKAKINIFLYENAANVLFALTLLAFGFSGLLITMLSLGILLNKAFSSDFLGLLVVDLLGLLPVMVGIAWLMNKKNENLKRLRLLQDKNKKAEETPKPSENAQ